MDRILLLALILITVAFTAHTFVYACDVSDPSCGHHPTNVLKGLMEVAYGAGDGIKGPALDKELKQVAKLSADGPLRFMGILKSESPGMLKDPGKDDQERISLDLTEEQLAEAPCIKTTFRVGIICYKGL
ncbi:MAG: hypothetical protein WCJ75_12635 [Desulfomonile sp.]